MTSKIGKCFSKALLNTTLSVGVTIVGDVVVEEINKVGGEVEVEGEDEEEDEVDVEVKVKVKEKKMQMKTMLKFYVLKTY